MAFPQTPLTHLSELYINGAWVDVTSYVYGREGNGVRITWGKADEGTDTDPAQCTFELDNRDGRFTTKLPTSPYCGQLGRGTQVRHSIMTGDPYLALPGTSTFAYAVTNDTAVLDVTGDLDVRLELTLDSDWLDAYGSNVVADSIQLVGKFNGPSQKSWWLGVRSGKLFFEWSADGTNSTGVSATQHMRVSPGKRTAIRVTFDVDNGASGNTATFYQSDSISGTWTQIGDPVVTAGTTSIFNSTANLAIGHATNFTFREPTGKVYKMEMRNGIGGTVVANPDFTAQTVGATSFTDGAGRSWSVNSPAAITNRNTRFFGRITSWPTRWQTGSKDATVKLTAAGSLRRLGQGASFVASALFREYTKTTRTGIIDYWPMEEGDQALSFASGLSGHQAMSFSGSIDLSTFDTYPPTYPLPTFGNGTASGAISPYTSSGFLGTRAFVQLSNTPPSSTVDLLTLKTTGTAKRWTVQVNTTNQMQLAWYDGDDALISSSGFGTFFPSTTPTHVLVTLNQNGANVDWAILVYDVSGSIDKPLVPLQFSGSAASITLGKGTTAQIGKTGNDLAGIAIGHVVVINNSSAFTATANAMLAWKGEQALTRFRRLASENAQAVISYPGTYSPTDRDTAMGAQGEATLLSLLRGCEAVSNGILFESRESDSLLLRTGDNMYATSPVFTLNYSGSDGLVTPLDPAEDDQNIVNDMTVTRTSGSSFQYVKTTGSLNSNFPETDPQGAGPYQDSVELDVWQDSQCEQFAWWRVNEGTWDEWRFPQVTILLQKAPSMVAAVTGVYPGDIFDITNMPSFAPPDTVRMRILGGEEFITQYRWEFTFNCQPGRPWDTAVESVGRPDTDGSTLSASLTTTATTAYVHTTSGPTWIDTAGFSTHFPFDIVVTGERMTATAIASYNIDAFGRTVSSGWGTSDGGLVWSRTGGSAADFAVGSGYGSHTLPSTSVSHLSFFAETYTDAAAKCDITSSATATGASLYGGLILRCDGTDANLYNAQMEFTTGNAAILTLRKRVASTETVLGTYNLLDTHTPGTFWRMRFEVIGTTVQAKAWLAANPEPGGWQLSVTDSALTTSADAGMRSVSVSGNTNVNPQLRYDNYEMYNPQAFTVTRSVNGVVKAHNAGEAVNVFTPYIPAL